MAAYFLRKIAANSNLAAVNIASRINFMRAGSAGYTGNFEIEFEIQLTGTSLPLISQDILDGQRLLIFTNTTTLEIRRPAGNISWSLPTSAVNRCVYRVVGNASDNTIQLFQNGSSLGTRSGADFIWVQTLFGFGSNTRNYDFYYLKIFNNGVLVHHYDPSASNGTGTTLIDTVGGNNGALVNFPTDNSQWVFYDAGGAANESTVSYDLGAIDYAVSSQITAPAYAASIGYDLGAIDYAVSAQHIAPGNNASLSYDIGAISYAVSAQQSAPQFSASVGYEIGGIGFAVQANTGAAIRTITALYDIGSIEWQVSSEWLPDDATAVIGYDIGEIAFNSSVLNIPEGGFPSEPSKQYPNNPGWRYSVFFR